MNVWALVARKTAHKDWLGAMPRECEKETNADLVTQVCMQVKYTEKRISTGESLLEKSRFWNVSYKKLTENPKEELTSIYTFLESNGLSRIK